ncbi:MAG TPA: amidohydrolase family protein [Novosphingobium sp.]|nr:amidohydrolase family protein [Novosphingobium sp.]
MPDFAALSRELAALGITGITDMTPQNAAFAAQHFAQQRQTGALRQGAMLAGTPALASAPRQGWTLGPVKLHLHEAALPDFDTALALFRSAHAQDRGVAIHCTTEVELVFTLALIEQAGAHRHDRIEHASIADPGHVARIAALGLPVCVQPHFIAERGDAYLADVEPHHHENLYRLASLADAGIALCGGSDAPGWSPPGPPCRLPRLAGRLPGGPWGQARP